MTKLSRTQQEFVDAMRVGVVVRYQRSYFSNAEPHYYRSDTSRKCTAIAKALMTKGLLRREGQGRDEKYVLTEQAKTLKPLVLIDKAE